MTPILHRVRNLFVLAAFMIPCLVSRWSQAAPVIGGWDLARGGVSSVKDSPALGTLRTLIQNVAPGATLTTTNTLTPEYLATVDSMFLSAPTDTDTVTTPLSAAEQTALFDFVSAGGTLAIVVENELVGPGTDGDITFESYLDPFGLDVDGRSNATTATVIDGAHLVTNGPYGSFAQFATSFSGWFDNLGPYAHALANDDDSGLPMLAVIEQGAISPTSGRVWLIADGHQAIDPSILNAEILLQNGMYYLLVPEPASSVYAGMLMVVAIVAGGRRWRGRR
jgi:hypothetical protein